MIPRQSLLLLKMAKIEYARLEKSVLENVVAGRKIH